MTSEQFTYESLRQAIVDTWGPAGAHVDLYDTLLRRQVELSSHEIELRNVLTEILHIATVYDAPGEASSASIRLARIQKLATRVLRQHK